MLNNQQQSLVESLLKFIADPKEKFFTVKGFAGTGKTFSIQEFLKLLPRNKYRICVTAPTNKAVSVIAQFGAQAGLFVPAKTTYSLLGLVLDNSNKNRHCKRTSEGSLHNYDIIIVDECSMVGESLSDVLIQNVSPRQKVIFMGDQYQLNPVHEGVSRTFNVKQQALLDKTMRQEEGPILELIRDVRQQCIDGTPPPYVLPRVDTNGDGLHLILGNDFINLAAAQFNLKTLELDTVENRYLAWSNKAVIAFNKKVRAKLYGLGADDYIVGETVSLHNPVYGEDFTPIFYTDDEVLISRVEVGKMTDFMDASRRKYNVWKLHVIGQNGTTGVIPILHKSSNGAYHRRLNELASAANAKKSSWSTYWDFKSLFIEVRHVYGMTIHRSQGSTIPNVFLDTSDMFHNSNTEELNRLIYVGASRAVNNLAVNRKVLSTALR